MEFRSLNELNLQGVASLWNEGFKGYFVDLTMTLDMFVKRVAADQLSLERSFALMKDDRPIGFVLNGFRLINGKKVAWNGGTAIVPEYRLQGIGKLLMKEALELYKREGVQTAWLEAIKANVPAISLYKQAGYEIVDQLAFYHQEGELAPDAFDYDHHHADECRLIYGVPQDVQQLHFYAHELPWQSQCTSIQNGQSIIAYNQEGQAAGYVLFKRVFDEQGVHKSTLLYQCVVEDNYAHREALMKRLLGLIYNNHEPVVRRTMNWSASHQDAVRLLEHAGFRKQTEQVHMKRALS